MNPTSPSLHARFALLLAFVAVHFGLGVICMSALGSTFGDVAVVYRDWVQAGLDGAGWIGIDTVAVYPTAALLPMLVSAVLGMSHFGITWLLLVGALDVAALIALTRGGTRHLALGWWWTMFLALLGPVAVGRIDAITVPLGIIAVVLLARRPIVAGALLTAAAWMKIWPAALVAAAVISGPRRAHVMIGALAVTLGVVSCAVVAGAHPATLFGFVGQQTGRGLQIEAPVSTLWLWLDAYGVGDVEIVYNEAINTFQLTGPGASFAAAATTPVMVLVVAIVAGLGMVALRRKADPVTLFGPLGLALVTALIVTNKVGSPQFESWLAVPLLAGMAVSARTFAKPAVVAAVVALLTQVVYPNSYLALIDAEPWIVGVITIRNLLLVGLLGWAVWKLWLAAFPRPVLTADPVALTRSPVEYAHSA